MHYTQIQIVNGCILHSCVLKHSKGTGNFVVTVDSESSTVESAGGCSSRIWGCLRWLGEATFH
jgi:hypothetical protein